MTEHSTSIGQLPTEHSERITFKSEGNTPGVLAVCDSPKLSMSQMTTYRWSLLDEVTCFRNLGIDAIGIWRPKLDEFGEERSVELIRDSGLSVSSVSWAGGFTGSNGHSFCEAVDDAREAIRMADRLNADCLVIVSGARGGHTLNHARRLVVAALQELGDYAAEYNVELAVQPMHALFSKEWTFLNSIDQTLDVLNAVAHPFVKMAFDVYQLWQEPRLVERIPELARYIATVQLSDWKRPPRSESDRCLIGDGQIPLEQLVGTLIENRYRGYFDIQIWSEELWGSDYVDLLKRCQERFRSMSANEALS